MTVASSRARDLPDNASDFGIEPNVWTASQHHTMRCIEVPRLDTFWHAASDADLGPVPHSLRIVFDVSECTPVGGALLKAFVSPTPGGSEFICVGQTLGAIGQVRIHLDAADLTAAPWPRLWLSLAHVLQPGASIAYTGRLVRA